MTILLIALGGAIGALLRVGIGKLLEVPTEATNFPYGTMAANLLGCLAMGVLYGVLRGVSDAALVDKLQPFLIAGLLGSLTTFSSLALDVLKTHDISGMAMASLYLSLSLVLGVGLCAIGVKLTGAAISNV